MSKSQFILVKYMYNIPSMVYYIMNIMTISILVATAECFVL